MPRFHEKVSALNDAKMKKPGIPATIETTRTGADTLRATRIETAPPPDNPSPACG
jgi:hypothetical protein